MPIAVVRPRQNVGYDAEYHIGLVADDDDPDVAAANTTKLNAAMEAMWVGGTFEFAQGGTGPILGPITFSGKEFFFSGTLKTATKNGGSLLGATVGTGSIPKLNYDIDSLGGVMTRLTKIDGEDGKAFLRLRGAGYIIDGFEFKGRPYYSDGTGEGPAGSLTLPAGTTATVSGIEVEGRGGAPYAGPSTGRNIIRNCVFCDFDCGIRVLGGLYDGDDFVSFETHAEECSVENVKFHRCAICWRTENQQAVNWTFRNLGVSGVGGDGLLDVIIFDCERAGCFWVDGLSIDDFRTTLIRLSTAYNPWGNYINIENVKWDRAMNALIEGGYAKLLFWDAPDNPDVGNIGYSVSDAKWKIRVTGQISYDDFSAPYPADVSQFIDLPPGSHDFPLDDIMMDIKWLNILPDFEKNFEPVGDGPWYRPTKAWAGTTSTNEHLQISEYDAVRHIGLVRGDKTPEAAAANTEKLNLALAAMHEAGNFEFINLSPGPVLKPIRFGAGAFFFAGTIKTAPLIGGAMRGFGSKTYPMLESLYANGALGGASTRLIRIDGEEGGPILRLCGTGFTVEGFEFDGREWLTNTGDETGFVGEVTDTAIEVEGRSNPASGQHTIRNCTFSQFTNGIIAKAGYYNGVSFVADENHADQSVVETCSFHDCGSVFRSENQQSVGWSFRDIQINAHMAPVPVIAFDIVRGGDIRVDRLMVNHGECVILQVDEYSPNTSTATIEGVKVDGGLQIDSYITWFKAVTAGSDLSTNKWSVRITGSFANDEDEFDVTKLIQVPAASTDFPLDDILLDVFRMPKDGFDKMGRWSVPTTVWMG